LIYGRWPQNQTSNFELFCAESGDGFETGSGSGQTSFKLPLPKTCRLRNSPPTS
jgi:hypothetical protein